MDIKYCPFLFSEIPALFREGISIHPLGLDPLGA